MELIWISLIILANVFVYVRKIILFRHGYKVAWFIIWGDWDNFMNIVDADNPPAKRRLLFVINIAPLLLFIMGVIVAILDWMRHEPWLTRIMTAAL